jgi:hypothetical protein
LTEEKLTRHPYSLPGGPAANLYKEIEKIKSSSKQELNEEKHLFYYPINSKNNKFKNIEWYSEQLNTIKIYTNEQSICFFLPKNIFEIFNHWIKNNQINIVVTQKKGLLFIDGSVKSGKTTIASIITPFILNELRKRKFFNQDFCFIYLNLSSLSHISNDEKKWKRLYGLFKKELKEFLNSNLKTNSYFLKLQDALQNLNKNYKWIIVIDEYHFLFHGLNPQDMGNMADTMKLILLDNDSPCYFILTGSTQATFWWSIHKARANGVNMKTLSTTLITPFESSEEEIKNCIDILIKEENANKEDLYQIKDLLLMKNVANLCQVSRYIKILKKSENYIQDSINYFINSKMEIYFRDYTLLPDAIAPDDFINIIENGTSSLFSQLQDLFIQKDGKYYIQDEDFKLFIKTFYDPRQKTISKI